MCTKHLEKKFNKSKTVMTVNYIYLNFLFTMLKKYSKTMALTLAFSLVLGGCKITQEEVPKTIETNELPQVEVMEVSFNGKKEFNINGEVIASQSANLTAEFKADVRSVFVKIGDKVTKGETLILLDSDSVQQSFSTASETLRNTQQNLSQTYASTAKSLESARVTLETAEITYDNLLTQNAISRKQAEEALDSAKLSLDLSTASAETTLETAEKGLEKIKELNASSENSSRDSLENAIKSVDSNIVSVINALDQILGISEIYDDSAQVWENNLGALDKQTKNEAEVALNRLMRNYENYSESYDNAKNILELADQSLSKSLSMLKKTTTGNNYSQTRLNTDIASITGQISSTQALLTNLIATKNGLDQTLASNASSLTSAEQRVISAQKSLDLTLQSSGTKSQNIINAETQYEATIRQLEISEENAEKQLESARIAYESAKKSVDLSKTSAKSGLTNAEGSFQQAKINQEKLLIKAPFDGTIVDIPVKVGDEINMGSLLAQVENADVLKIVTYLTPEQTKSLQVGDMVKIATQSEDKISAISSTVDPIIKKNKIEILHKNPYLHSGQTVPLTFTIESETNAENGVVFIPLVAVHVTSSESYVWLVDEDKTEKRIIKTGEINGNKIAINSGLNEKDKIIVKGGRLLKKAGEEVEVVK